MKEFGALLLLSLNVVQPDTVSPMSKDMQVSKPPQEESPAQDLPGKYTPPNLQQTSEFISLGPLKLLANVPVS
jgi:hypothetical protein